MFTSASRLACHCNTVIPYGSKLRIIFKNCVNCDSSENVNGFRRSRFLYGDRDKTPLNQDLYKDFCNQST